MKFIPVIESRSVRDVLTLASGRLGAAAIGLLSAPFIARLFVPEHYGIAALFIAIATPASIVLPLAYQNAIVVPKEKERAQALTKLAVFATLLLFGFVFLLMGSTQLFTLPRPFADRLGLWIWAIPLAMLVLALSLICEGWLTRTRGFVPSAKATFLQAAVTSGGRLSTGAVWGTSTWGLIVPYLTGLILHLWLLAQAVWQRRDHAETPTTGPVSTPAPATVPLKDIAREYREFPTYNLPAGFLRAMSDNLPILFFAPVFGAAAAGFYAMADRLIKAPLTMGAMSVRRVYQQRASAILHRGGDLQKSYHRVTAYLALLGLLPLLLLMLAGQPLMEFILGDRWTRAGLFAEILAPWLYLMLITRPATALVDLLRQQRLWLWTQVSSTLLRILAMLLAWRWGGSEEWVLWGFVLGGAPPYIWLMLHINRLSTTNGIPPAEKQDVKH